MHLLDFKENNCRPAHLSLADLEGAERVALLCSGPFFLNIHAVSRKICQIIDKRPLRLKENLFYPYSTIGTLYYWYFPNSEQ